MVVAVGLVSPVGRLGDDGNAQVDPQHVDHAESEEGQAGHNVPSLHRFHGQTAAKYCKSFYK